MGCSPNCLALPSARYLCDTGDAHPGLRWLQAVGATSRVAASVSSNRDEYVRGVGGRSSSRCYSELERGADQMRWDGMTANQPQCSDCIQQLLCSATVDVY